MGREEDRAPVLTRGLKGSKDRGARATQRTLKYKEDRVRAELGRAVEAEVWGFALLWAAACGLESARIWASWPILGLGKLRQVDYRKFEAMECVPSKITKLYIHKIN